MFKPLALALSFLLLTAQPLLAQQQQPSLHDPMAHRNHLGFNTQTVLRQFFDQDRRTPLEMMYKRQVHPSGAFRLGTRLAYEHDYTDNASFDSAIGFRWERNSTLQTAISIGYEWQRVLGRRWLFHYGIDLNFQFNQRIMERHNSRGEFFEPVAQGRAIAKDRDTRNTFSPSIEPLAGLRFQIVPRLYASLEAKAVFQYTSFKYWGRSKYVYVDADVTDAFGLDEWRRSNVHNEKGLDFNFYPHSGLSLFYLF